MIIARGGFSAFEDNPRVHSKLLWSFIALAEPWPGSNPIYLEKHNASENNQDEANPANQEERWTKSFAKSCDELTSLIAKRTQSVLNSLPQSEAQYQSTKSKYPHRHSTFSASSTLSRLLSNPNPTILASHPHTTLTHCRLACLLYSNILLSSPSHTDFSPATESFLATLTSLVADDDFDVNLSAEHLLWALIQGVEPNRDEDAHRERCYATSRMLGVMKCVSQQTWESVEELLRMFLRMPTAVEEVRGQIERWDGKGLRREVEMFLYAGGVVI